MTSTTSAPPRAQGERSNRLLIIAAVVVAAIAGLLVFAALQSTGGSSSASSADQQVLVASRDLDADTTLKEDMLEFKTVPKDQAVRGFYEDKSAAMGQTLLYPVLKGQQVSSTQVGAAISKTEKRSLSYVVPATQRAISVKSTEVAAVGGNLLPGDRVDVIAVFDDNNSTGNQSKAVTILQNVQVLAVAQEAQVPLPADATPAPGATATSRRPDEAKVNPDARTVTLAVTPEDAQLMALIDKNATIYLSLRPPGENDATPYPTRETNLLPYGVAPRP